MSFYDGQTETERVIERLHGEDIKIVELKIVTITPKPPYLSAYTEDVEMAVIERCQPSIVAAFSEDKNRNEIFRVNAADGAFIVQVAEPIAEHILPPNVTNDRIRTYIQQTKTHLGRRLSSGCGSAGARHLRTLYSLLISFDQSIDRRLRFQRRA